MACIIFKIISSAQAGSTQGGVNKPFHTACVLEKLFPGFQEKVDLCLNDIRNCLKANVYLVVMDFSKLQAWCFSDMTTPVRKAVPCKL